MKETAIKNLTRGGVGVMAKLSWNEQFNIGVEVIDKAHAKLFRIVGKLMDHIENEANYQNACRESIVYLENYTMTHFSEEEEYMRAVGYKGYDQHKKIHDDFRDKTLVFYKKYLEASDYSPEIVRRFLGVLAGWLTGHIMAEDQAITGNVSEKKVYEELMETPVIASAVSQAMKEVFHLPVELADAEYNGRNIGKGFYYRLYYDIDDGGKVQLLIGVEKQLARRGAGIILGIAALNDPELVKNASLQVLEQFFHRMGKLFNSNTVYQLKKDEMLTKDEFREDFMTRYPCSMLFETRLGNFVFCAKKWKARTRKK